jgi:Condensin II non structural maintenance of chromosomes subunit
MARKAAVAAENKENHSSGSKSFSKQDTLIAKTSLFEASANISNIRPFLNLFGAATSNSNVPKQLKDGLTMREQRHLVLQTVKALSEDEASLLFASLATMVQNVVDKQLHIPESAFATEDNEGDEYNDDRDIVLDAKSKTGLSFLYYVALCVSSFVETRLDGDKHGARRMMIPSEVIRTAISLHDVLDQIESSWGIEAADALNLIASLCDTWWVKNGPSKEDLILQSLPIFVEAALAHSSTKAAVQRLWNVRTALQTIDFEDDASGNFGSLLLNLASLPHILQSTEGKRLLSFIMVALGPTMRNKLHQAIRVQIPGNKKSILQAYGTIFFTAWKEAVDKDEPNPIESDVLQDLVYSILHAASPSTVESLHIVLEPFHEHKKNAGVERLLHRLYGPVLWRCLAAANAVVRVNAARVLMAVFPLQGRRSHPNNMVSSNPIEKGMDALTALLQDPDPRVRVIGSEAVTKILTTYWDALPSKSIRNLLNRTYS